MNKEKFESLQALRFFAAFGVVLFHLFDYYHVKFGFKENYFIIGEFGVDVFFIMSGFIVAYTTNYEKGPGAFAIKRLSRVVPLYWILTTFVLFLVLLAPGAFNSTGLDFGNYVKSLLFIPYQKENGLVQPMLFLGWTLNYEMLFYAVVGVALLSGRNFLANACLFIAILAVAGRIFPSSNVVWSFYTGGIILEFVFGVLVYALLKEFPRQFRFYAKLSLLPAAILAGVLIFGHVSTPRPFGQGLIAMAIVAFAITVQLPAGIGSAWLVALGDASYSLYLSHPFILQVFIKFCEKHYSPALLVLGSAAAVIGCFALSLVLYRWLERPSQLWLVKQLSTGGRAVHYPAAVEPA